MGIGYVTLSSRKRPIALEPLESGIRGITLRHIEDMRLPRRILHGHSGAAITA